MAPPGAAENEMEQFRRMEMVDMVITRIWFSGRKSRSVNNFLQPLDLDPNRIIFFVYQPKLRPVKKPLVWGGGGNHSARHNYPGGGPNVRKKLGHPPGQPNMRWSNYDTWKL